MGHVLPKGWDSLVANSGQSITSNPPVFHPKADGLDVRGILPQNGRNIQVED